MLHDQTGAFSVDSNMSSSELVSLACGCRAWALERLTA
jgi:hypothetical protein